MNTRKLIGIGTAAVLAAITFALAPAASAQGYGGDHGHGYYGQHHDYGQGMMGGYGPRGYYHVPGMMGGYNYNYATPRQRCAARFRSFDWRTGLYTTYDGEKRLCPYLR